MKIVSLLPSGTEMVAKLGRLDSLVGRTFECDYPPAVEDVEIMVRPVVDQSIEDHGEIDRRIDETLQEEGTIYRVDEQRLQTLNPDLLITQDLCEVCAPSDREVVKVIDEMDDPPEVVSMSPASIEDIIENMEELAEATNSRDRFEEWRNQAVETFNRLAEAVPEIEQPTVVCVEWYDPIYVGGHWVPQQVDRAGGKAMLSKSEQPSHVVAPEEIVSVDPDILILMPCGMTAEEAITGTDTLMKHEGFDRLTAIQNDRVYAVDASAYFARPGPRVVEGTTLLAHLFHGDTVSWSGSREAYRIVSL